MLIRSTLSINCTVDNYYHIKPSYKQKFRHYKNLKPVVKWN